MVRGGADFEVEHSFVVSPGDSRSFDASFGPHLDLPDQLDGCRRRKASSRQTVVELIGDGLISVALGAGVAIIGHGGNGLITSDLRVSLQVQPVPAE